MGYLYFLPLTMFVAFYLKSISNKHVSDPSIEVAYKETIFMMLGIFI